MEDTKLAICCDLDGTLLKVDCLQESIILAAKTNPLNVLRMAWILLTQGKPALKTYAAQFVTPAIFETFPHRTELLEYLRERSDDGHRLHLCTGASPKIADMAMARFPIFSSCMSSSDSLNLTGKNKSQQIVQKFGRRNFIYAGNANVDLPIWSDSAGAIVVYNNNRFLKRAEQVAEVTKSISGPKLTLKTFVRALRLHQWSKNTLVFVPLFLSTQFTNMNTWLEAIIAFFAFSACASSVYLINDLLDLTSDRRHNTKCQRPLASGTLSIPVAIVTAIVLIVAAATLASFTTPMFHFTLAGYFTFTLLYTFYLKGLAMIDVLVLSMLYTLRLFAGGMAEQIELSSWLLLFSVFFFLSLAWVKRYSELARLQSQGAANTTIEGRDYYPQDAAVVLNFGTVSGMISILIFALYLESSAVRNVYSLPALLWAIVPILLFWQSRIWLLAARGAKIEDPIAYALKDRVSYVLLFLIAVVLICARVLVLNPT